MMSNVEIRAMAVECKKWLIEKGDPFRGDDWNACQVVEAYLNLVHEDDEVDADKEWMVTRGWVWEWCRYSWKTTGIIGLATVGVEINVLPSSGVMQVYTEQECSAAIPCRCNTRGDIRRIEAMFKLPVKEAK